MTDQAEVARLLSEAGEARAGGDLESAERALRRVLRLQEADLGPTHPEVANTLNDLGVICDELGRPQEAEFLYRRALGLAQKALPSDHPYIATSLENLATLYRDQGWDEKLADLEDVPSVSPATGPTGGDGADASAGPGSVTATGPSAAGGEVPTPLGVRDGDVEAPWLAGVRAAWQGLEPLARVALLGGGVLLVILVVAFVGGDSGPGVATSAETEAAPPVTGEAAAPVTEVAEATPGSNAAETPPPEEPSDPDPERPDAEPDLSDPEPEPVEPADPEPVEDVPPSSPAPVVAANDAGDEAAEPVATVPESPAPDPAPGDLSVVSAEVCVELDRSARFQWQCRAVDGSAAAGGIYYYTRVRSPRSTTVEHRWIFDGEVERRVGFEIEPNYGPGYRTFSYHRVRPGQVGEWRLELWAGGTQPLHAESLVVR